MEHKSIVRCAHRPDQGGPSDGAGRHRCGADGAVWRRKGHEARTRTAEAAAGKEV